MREVGLRCRRGVGQQLRLRLGGQGQTGARHRAGDHRGGDRRGERGPVPARPAVEGDRRIGAADRGALRDLGLEPRERGLQVRPAGRRVDPRAVVAVVRAPPLAAVLFDRADRHHRLDSNTTICLT